MIIFAVGSSSSLAKEVLYELSKKYKIIGTYNKKKPNKILFKKNIKFLKLDLKSKKLSFFLMSFLKKNKITNEKIILLNFAVYKKNELLINESEKNIQENFNINIRANINLVKFFLPVMIKNNFGRIIHFSSTKVLDGEIGTSLYAASKSFLNGLSVTVAKEYGKFNITSNILSLGYFKSNLWDAISPKIKKERLKDVPSKKLGSIKNISNAIEFLINSEYVNKSIIKIDGGI